MMKHFLLLTFLAGACATHNTLPDSASLLASLGKYKKLYLSYENCAWSTYGEEGQENPCNAQEGDEDYWYLGLTGCMRANAAYSVYGVLSGAEDEGCTKATFINSFFTTTGIENFVQSLADVGVAFSEQEDGAEVELSSECQAVDDGGEDNNGDNNGDEEQYDYTANNRKIYEDKTSVGLGCSDKNFVYKKYKGSYCDERTESQITDSLSNFNQELQKATCIVIYEASQNNGDDENGDNQQQLDILEDSVSCNIRLYPHQCPDPYKVLSSNSRAIVKDAAKEAHPTREMVKTVFSWILLGFGGILMAFSAVAYCNKSKLRGQQEAYKQRRQEQGKSSIAAWRAKFTNQSTNKATNESVKASASTKTQKRGFRRLFSRNAA